MADLKSSPDAAARVWEVLDSWGERDDPDELMGETDCPEGCLVEPDGQCPHGFLSAGRSAGLI